MVSFFFSQNVWNAQIREMFFSKISVFEGTLLQLIYITDIHKIWSCKNQLHSVHTIINVKNNSIEGLLSRSWCDGRDSERVEECGLGQSAGEMDFMIIDLFNANWLLFLGIVCKRTLHF